ncbi:Deoxyuridine 5'-triphosphate nucleotidohydrolase [bacterium AB1]|nr:Deoxyuridine 5'-triphosphate nucleotidohydrolase [bacterium AB1]
MKVNIITQDSKLYPIKSTKYSSGYDLYSSIDLVIKKNEIQKVPTGISLDIDLLNKNTDILDIQIRPRSSLSLKNINVAIGTIDIDYKGELQIIINNNSNQDFVIKKYDCIAQLVFGIRGNNINFYFNDQELDLVKNVERVGGFGSTNKNKN